VLRLLTEKLESTETILIQQAEKIHQYMANKKSRW